jgi:hypothetical protein
MLDYVLVKLQRISVGLGLARLLVKNEVNDGDTPCRRSLAKESFLQLLLL